MNNKPIGVFDSGIGGIMVLNQLVKKMPYEKYVYLGDNKHFPYGEKTKEEIIEYTRQNIKILLKNNVKMIIIACGTATSQALDIVKNEFDIPIIGIIEPTVKYVADLKLDKIGIMATTGTIRSGAWEKKMKLKIPKINVYNLACPILASLAENDIINSKKGKDAIHNYMEFFKDNGVNNIVLGCTHYPIYEKMIKDEYNGNVNLIDTGKAMANMIDKYLQNNNMKNLNLLDILEPEFLCTDISKDFIDKAKKMFENMK